MLAIARTPNLLLLTTTAAREARPGPQRTSKLRFRRALVTITMTDEGRKSAIDDEKTG